MQIKILSQKPNIVLTGGDEINKIIYKGNYGWPISSYGEKYDFYERQKTNKKEYLMKFDKNIPPSKLILDQLKKYDVFPVNK